MSEAFSLDLNDYRVGPKCDLPAAYRYTWPGKDESYACERHAGQLNTVAGVIGLHLQLIPVPTEAELKCQQFV